MSHKNVLHRNASVLKRPLRYTFRYYHIIARKWAQTKRGVTSMSKRIYLLGKWCYLPLFLRSSDEGGDVKKCVRTSYATHPHLEKSVNAYINLGMPVRPRQFMSFCMVVRTFLIQITCFLLSGWQKVPTETLSIIRGPIISGAHCDNLF